MRELCVFWRECVASLASSERVSSFDLSPRRGAGRTVVLSRSSRDNLSPQRRAARSPLAAARSRRSRRAREGVFRRGSVRAPPGRPERRCRLAFRPPAHRWPKTSVSSALRGVQAQPSRVRCTERQRCGVTVSLPLSLCLFVGCESITRVNVRKRSADGPRRVLAHSGCPPSEGVFTKLAAVRH